MNIDESTIDITIDITILINPSISDIFIIFTYGRIIKNIICEYITSVIKIQMQYFCYLQ